MRGNLMLQQFHDSVREFLGIIRIDTERSRPGAQIRFRVARLTKSLPVRAESLGILVRSPIEPLQDGFHEIMERDLQIARRHPDRSRVTDETGRSDLFVLFRIGKPAGDHVGPVAIERQVW